MVCSGEYATVYDIMWPIGTLCDNDLVRACECPEFIRAESVRTNAGASKGNHERRAAGIMRTEHERYSYMCAVATPTIWEGGKIK